VSLAFLEVRAVAAVLALIFEAVMLADRVAAFTQPLAVAAGVALPFVLAVDGTAALPALALESAVFAEVRAAALAATGLDPPVRADLRASALHATGTLTVVLTDRRTPALLADVTAATMLTDLGPAARLAPVAALVMLAVGLPASIQRANAPPPIAPVLSVRLLLIAAVLAVGPFDSVLALAGLVASEAEVGDKLVFA